MNAPARRQTCKGFNCHSHVRGCLKPRDRDHQNKAFEQQRQALNSMLRMCAETQSVGFGGAVLMPNLPEPICDAEGYLEYGALFREALPDGRDFKPVIAVQLHDGTSHQTLKEVREAGCKVLKVYPEKVTNSVLGVCDLTSRKMLDRYLWAEELGFIVSFHGQIYCDSIFDGEKLFQPKLQQIYDATETLVILMEHISLASSLEMILDMDDRVRATFTPHHLLCSQLSKRVARRKDAVLDRYLHCQPPLQGQWDSLMILAAILDPWKRRKLALGLDDAPHLMPDKEGDNPKAGIWAPSTVALSLLCGLFGSFGAIAALNDVLQNGWSWYSLEPSTEWLQLVEEPWQVPSMYPVEGTGTGVIPFHADRWCKWKIVPNDKSV